MFEHDTVLIPKETAWFGYYEDESFKSILSPQQTDLFTEDWIGLRNLDEAGRVMYISVAGGHLGISTSDMKKHVVPYLQVSASMMDGNKKASYTRASGVELGFVESNEKMQVTPDFDDRASINWRCTGRVVVLRVALTSQEFVQ
nr:palmitoyl-protein thioesterase 1-like [Malus domestica]